MKILQQNIGFLLKKNKGNSTPELSMPIKDISDGKAIVNPEDLVKLSDHFGYSIDILLKRNLQLMDSLTFSNIQLLVLDIDGVMTDGGMYYTEKGDEFKRFDNRSMCCLS